MRVVHFRKHFSRLSETFIYDVVREVGRQGGQSIVLCVERELAATRPHEPVHALGEIVDHGPVRRAARLAARLSTIGGSKAERRRVRSDLRTALARLKPDVVHAHFGWDGELVAPAAVALGIPLVVSFHGADALMLPSQPVWRRRYTVLANQASAVTAVSQFMASVLMDLGFPAQQLRVVHVGKPLADYVFRVPSGPVDSLVMVGRLVQKKGGSEALRALASVVRSGWTGELEIIGDGPLRYTLEREARTLGLTNRVRFRGALPHPEVTKALARADAFLLPSRTGDDGDMEGLPTVLLEAQATGLPWVATRHSGIPEGVPPALRSELVPEGNIDALAAALRQLIELPEDVREERAEMGRRWVEEHFSLEQEVGRLMDIYKGLTEEGNPT